MINRKIKILLIGSNIWYLGEGMLGPLFAVFAERIGGDILSISWAWAVYLIITGFFYIIVGKISDEKVNKEKLMIAGYGLNAFFTFCYLTVSSPIHLFFVTAGLGVSTALASPTWSSLYSKYEDKEKSGYIWGLAGGWAQIVAGLAVIIGGLIINYFSFTTLFITMGIIQIIATVYQTQILKK